MPFRFAALAVAAVAALTVCHAGAQTAAPGSRAEDEASRPLRRIIEASKIKPKPKVADAAPRPAATPASAAPTLPARATAAAAETAAPLASPAAPAAPADPGGPPQSTVATVEVEASPRTPPPEAQPQPQPQPDAAPAPQASVALPPPKLLSLVEPVTPRGLAGRLRGEIRVDVALSVAADGSVSEAAVTASSHPQMNDAVLEAVRQWRYEPAGRVREHAVQVVLRPDS